MFISGSWLSLVGLDYARLGWSGSAHFIVLLFNAGPKIYFIFFLGFFKVLELFDCGEATNTSLVSLTRNNERKNYRIVLHKCQNFHSMNITHDHYDRFSALKI